MSKEKWLYLGVALLCVVGLLAVGCAKEVAPTPTPTPTPKPTPTPTPTPTKPAKVFSWKLQSAWPPPEKLLGYLGGYGQYCEFARRVKERTDGGVDIKVYVPNALFKVLEAPEALKKGAIEVLGSSGPYHGSVLPESYLEWGLPYGVNSREQSNKLRFDTDYYKIYAKAFEEKHNAKVVAVDDVSSYCYMTTFPVNKLSDLKGKKIRAAGNTGKVVKLQGGVPVTLAGAEQYTALQRGTVDGTVYPTYAGITYKMFEVVKYMSWPPFYYTSCVNILVNMDAWNTLPKEYQDIMLEVGEEVGKYTYNTSADALSKISREEGKKQFGTESIWLSDAELAKFKDAAIPLWDEFALKSDYCAQMVKIAKEVAGVK